MRKWAWLSQQDSALPGEAAASRDGVPSGQPRVLLPEARRSCSALRVPQEPPGQAQRSSGTLHGEGGEGGSEGRGEGGGKAGR